MKILHWANELGLGGTPKTLEQFAIELQKRGHENLVVCYEDGDLSRRINLEKGKVRVLTISRAYRQYEFDVDIMNWGPDIVHVYRSGYAEFPEPASDFSLSGAKFVETNVFGHHDINPNIHKTIFMSQYLQYIAGKTVGDRYDFINNPIPKPPDHYRQYYQFYDDRINLGRSGRPENGIYASISIEAIGLLIDKRPELRNHIRFIALAPPSNMIKDLERLNIEYFAIQPTINDEEIWRFYNTIDIALHARLDGETCGNSIQEPMMHGIPVITHVSEPNNDAIFPFQAQCFLVEDGTTGFVVPHDVGKYAEAIEKLIDDVSLRRRMGWAAKDKALKNFETSVCVDKLERIYKEILND